MLLRGLLDCFGLIVHMNIGLYFYLVCFFYYHGRCLYAAHASSLLFFGVLLVIFPWKMFFLQNTKWPDDVVVTRAWSTLKFSEPTTYSFPSKSTVTRAFLFLLPLYKTPARLWCPLVAGRPGRAEVVARGTATSRHLINFHKQTLGVTPSGFLSVSQVDYSY